MMITSKYTYIYKILAETFIQQLRQEGATAEIDELNKIITVSYPDNLAERIEFVIKTVKPVYGIKNAE